MYTSNLHKTPNNKIIKIKENNFHKLFILSKIEERIRGNTINYLHLKRGSEKSK